MIKTRETEYYADDATSYTVEGTVPDIITSLEKYGKRLFKWFGNNFMKRNIKKNHLLLHRGGFSCK